MAELFGFEINRKGQKLPELPSFVPNTDDDGVGVIYKWSFWPVR